MDWAGDLASNAGNPTRLGQKRPYDDDGTTQGLQDHASESIPMDVAAAAGVAQPGGAQEKRARIESTNASSTYGANTADAAAAAAAGLAPTSNAHQEQQPTAATPAIAAPAAAAKFALESYINSAMAQVNAVLDRVVAGAPLHSLCTTLLNAVVTYRERGRLVGEIFAELPTPLELPDYYAVIGNPMDTVTLGARVGSTAAKCSYSTFAAFDNDMMKVFVNAEYYNKSGSTIYRDAGKLRKAYETTKSALATTVLASPAAWTNANVAFAATAVTPMMAQSPRSSSSSSSSSTKQKDRFSTPPAASSRATRQNIPGSAGGAGSAGEESDMMDTSSGSKSADAAAAAAEKGASWHTTTARIVKLIRRCLGCIAEIASAVSSEDSHTFAKSILFVPSAQEHPGYHQLYAPDPPLDFIAIRKRAGAGQYDSFESLLNDIVTMCDALQRYYGADSSQGADAAAVRAVARERTRDARRRYMRMYKQANAPLIPNENEYGVRLQPSPTSTTTAGSLTILNEEALRELLSEATHEEVASDVFPGGRTRTESRRPTDRTAQPSPGNAMDTTSSSSSSSAATTACSDAGVDGLLDSKRLLQCAMYDLCAVLEAATVDDEDEQHPGQLAKRRLIEDFVVLPTPDELPEYYTIITEPIDLSTIKARIEENAYSSFAAFRHEIFLMFHNARIFNEAGSTIFEDSVALQKLFIEHANRRFAPGVGHIPFTDVDFERELVIEALLTDSTPDACFSPPDGTLPELDRLQALQDAASKRGAGSSSHRKERKATAAAAAAEQEEEEEERAGAAAATSGNASEGNGSSTAPAAAAATAAADANGLANKLSVPQQIQEVLAKYAASQGLVEVESATLRGILVKKDGYVRINHGKCYLPRVIWVENIYRYTPPGADAAAQPRYYIWGSPFLYPHETYHLVKTTFLANEIFRGPAATARWYHSDLILSECTIVFTKEWLRDMRPPGFAPADVFCCDGRYNEKSRTIQRIKTWNTTQDHLVPSPENESQLNSVLYTKYPSLHAMTNETMPLFLQDIRHELAQTQANANEIDFRVLPVNFQRFVVGEVVYLRSTEDPGAGSLLRITRIWLSASSNEPMFTGIVLVRPSRTTLEASSNASLHPRELLLTHRSESHALAAVGCKISVLSHADYELGRSVGFAERDVFFSRFKLATTEDGVLSLLPSTEEPQRLLHTDFVLFSSVQSAQLDLNLVANQLAAGGVTNSTKVVRGGLSEAVGAPVFVVNPQEQQSLQKLNRVQPPLALFDVEVRQNNAGIRAAIAQGVSSSLLHERVSELWRALSSSEKRVYETVALKAAEALHTQQASALQASLERLRLELSEAIQARSLRVAAEIPLVAHVPEETAVATLRFAPVGPADAIPSTEYTPALSVVAVCDKIAAPAAAPAAHGASASSRSGSSSRNTAAAGPSGSSGAYIAAMASTVQQVMAYSAADLVKYARLAEAPPPAASALQQPSSASSPRGFAMSATGASIGASPIGTPMSLSTTPLFGAAAADSLMAGGYKTPVPSRKVEPAAAAAAATPAAYFNTPLQSSSAMLCCWLGCYKGPFLERQALLDHVEQTHFDPQNAVCQWEDCEREGKRYTYSNKLMTHIADSHLNPQSISKQKKKREEEMAALASPASLPSIVTRTQSASSVQVPPSHAIGGIGGGLVNDGVFSSPFGVGAGSQVFALRQPGTGGAFSIASNYGPVSFVIPSSAPHPSQPLPGTAAYPRLKKQLASGTPLPTQPTPYAAPARLSRPGPASVTPATGPLSDRPLRSVRELLAIPEAAAVKRSERYLRFLGANGGQTADASLQARATELSSSSERMEQDATALLQNILGAV
ncbi:hypothetical protein CAOG_04193 [Capsaspora owczarzaki ATCC 30864]|uniref:Bromo domain-containing protein n=1 Tax=Capsaspora owczarzaki (strain ATCC 30864) TaxID=595528 RepID=A0A0D2X2Z1_CAPO3|nr:hypothetical protein CAOG_04193 [Capsaspora owczarzaki ATCC 30864]KJE93399.1 hypothetical protein CAOG_004193 [Capsaspora owczarzaki ATCC 30864]|eukprot:XP_004348018.1 hypothetical protein CAOG_04193 [Capsaspora owczarzaki ATCC 30864]